MYSFFFKRIFDITIALFGLMVLSPLIAVIALLVRWKMGSPVLFCQPRAGLYERIFTLYKFRTMTNQTHDAQGRIIPDDQRLTPFGRWLRRTSLDELPQLWNVLKGDMSLVGPRPLPVKYLPRYTPLQHRRHWVRPGITGWAQVNGRNNLTWQEKFQMDIWYVENLSFWLDLKILVLTALNVVRGKDVAKQGYATVDEFLGDPSF